MKKRTVGCFKNNKLTNEVKCIAILGIFVGILAFFKIVPFLITIKMSFFYKDSSLLQSNFSRILTDSLIKKYLINSIVIYILGAIPEVVFGFLLAGLMTYFIKSNRIKSLFSTFFYLPSIVSSITIASLFSFMFDAKYGIINHMLQHFKLGPIEVLKGGWISVVFMAFICFWQWFGYDAFIFVVVLNGINNSVLQQATIDGAKFLTVIKRIYFPHAMPIIFYLLLTSFVSSIQMFDVPFILKNNYSANSVTTFGLYVYDTAFSRFQFGYASVLSILQFAIIFIGSMIMIFLYRNSAKKYL